MDPLLASRFSMNTMTIELAKLALRSEVTMEHLVDVECANADRELYLLQCRPITTLK